MIGYMFLALALLAGATKGFCGKKISTATKEFGGAVKVNFIRMLFCIVIGIAVTLLKGEWGYIIPNGTDLIIALVSGVFTGIFVVTWLLSVRRNAYMMIEIFLTLGVAIPLIMSAIIFNEAVTVRQIIGIAILAVGVYLMCLYNTSLKGKITFGDWALLLACGLSSGVTDFSQKLFIKSNTEMTTSVFNLYTYVFCAILLGIFCLIVKGKVSEKGEKVITPRVFTFILIMALCLFANSYFKTVAAGYLDAVKLYPLNQGGALILSTLMAALLFREKITLNSIVGTVIAFAGLLVINM